MRAAIYSTSVTAGFLAATIAIGLVALAVGLVPFQISDVPRFLCYFLVAAASAYFRVSLPTFTGTLTINFLFTLIGIVELSLSETLLMTTAITALQCLLSQERGPTVAKTLFNVSSVSIAVIAAYALYHGPLSGPEGSPASVRLIGAALVLYVMTTVPVGIAIGLTERRSIVVAWKQCSLWAAPYYLAGAGFAVIFTAATEKLGWHMAIIVPPVAYLITRSYQLYLKRLTEERQQAESVAALHLRTIEALALAIDAKNSAAHNHLRDLQSLSVSIGAELGLSDEDLAALKAAALLHDVGKLAVPEHVVLKPGPLTADEFEKMKIHPIVGAEIVEQAQFPYPVAPIIRSHHEKWDGTGYPCGLRGEAIPVTARILAAVDCLYAMVTDRTYRQKHSLKDAFEYLRQESGKAFDPAIVDLLLRRRADFESMVTPGAREDATESLHSLCNAVSQDTAAIEAASSAFASIGRPAEPAAEFLTSIASARQEVQTLFELSQNLGSSLSLDETLSVLGVRLNRMVPHDSLVIYVETDGLLRPRFAQGEGSRVFASLSIPTGQGLSGWVIEHQKPILNGNPSVEFGYLNDSSKFSTMRSALIVPLSSQTGFRGALALYAGPKEAFSNDHPRVLASISAKLSHSIENALKYELAETSATTDFLTGLPNARSLFLQLDAEINRCRRQGTTLDVLVCDLDGFKQVNDRFGHLEGNRVLKLVAERLKENCREYDYVARMGGDEFILLLPGSPSTIREERLSDLSAIATAAGQEICGSSLLSLSVGAATFPEDATDAERLIAVADERMYRVKSTRSRGRGDAYPHQIAQATTDSSTRANTYGPSGITATFALTDSPDRTPVTASSIEP